MTSNVDMDQSTWLKHICSSHQSILMLCWYAIVGCADKILVVLIETMYHFNHRDRLLAT